MIIMKRFSPDSWRLETAEVTSLKVSCAKCKLSARTMLERTCKGEWEKACTLRGGVPRRRGHRSGRHNRRGGCMGPRSSGSCALECLAGCCLAAHTTHPQRGLYPVVDTNRLRADRITSCMRAARIKPVDDAPVVMGAVLCQRW